MPEEAAVLAQVANSYPENGRFLDLLHNVSQERKKKSSEDKKRLREENRQQNVVSSQQFTCDGNTTTGGAMPILKGSVCVCIDGDNHIIMKCCGYFVSFFPGDRSRSVIVLQEVVEGKEKLIPCICPTNLISGSSIEALMKKRINLKIRNVSRIFNLQVYQ